MEENTMKKYYISNHEDIARPWDAIAEFNTEEEAVAAAEDMRKEILDGVYDEEWAIEEAERAPMADCVRAYVAEFTGGGNLKSVFVLE